MIKENFILKITNILNKTLFNWAKNYNKYEKGGFKIIVDYINADCGFIGITIDFSKEELRDKVNTLLKKHNINYFSTAGFGGLFPIVDFTIKESNINNFKSFFIELNNNELFNY